MSELTVILKDSDRTYRQKFLIYDTYTIDANDQIIQDCIEEAKNNFDGEPETVEIRIYMEV